MGRIIRRVPPNWNHPKKEVYTMTGKEMRYQPMYSRSFDDAYDEWRKDYDRVKAGNLTDFERECFPNGFIDWLMDSPTPDARYYEPFTSGEATWFQVWETVSEGTPVTPPFETEDELVDYLTKNGDFWDQKRGDKPMPRENYEKFVKGPGWAPTFVSNGRKLMTGVEAVTQSSD